MKKTVNKKWFSFIAFVMILVLAACSTPSTSDLKSPGSDNVQVSSQTQTQLPTSETKDIPKVTPVTSSKPEIQKEIHVEWQKSQLFPVPDFLKSNPNLAESHCDQVGKVSDGKYQNWSFILCSTQESIEMGYFNERAYRLLMNPQDLKALPVLLSQEMDPENLPTESEKYVVEDMPIVGLEYPKTISLKTPKGPLVFDFDYKFINLDYYYQVGHFDNGTPGKILFKDPLWGNLLQDEFVTNQGGLLLKRKDGSYVAYRMNYDDFLGWGTKNRYSNPEDMIWEDGNSHKISYTMGYVFHCEAETNAVYLPEEIFDLTQLKKVASTKKGDPLYAFSNIENDFFRYISENFHPLADLSQLEKGDDPTQTIQKAVTEDFSILFWQDPLGRWIEFRDARLTNC